MVRHESSGRCPRCGCANDHQCEYERCGHCGQRSRPLAAWYADGDVRVPPRESLSEALFAGA
jgi:predicted amidophosphoribosyltransferase